MDHLEIAGDKLSRSDSLKESRRSKTSSPCPSAIGTTKKNGKKPGLRSRYEGQESLPNSTQTTPKRRIHDSIREDGVVRRRDTPQNSPPDLCLNILGSPAPRKTERAHSLPGVSAVRRSSLEAQQYRRRRERATRNSLGGKEQLLDLALISDFENERNREASTERCAACSAALDTANSSSRTNSNRTYSIRRYSLQNSSARSHSTSQIPEDSQRRHNKDRDKPRSRKSSLSSSRRASSRYAELDYSSEIEMTSGHSSREKSPGRSTSFHRSVSQNPEKTLESGRTNSTAQGEWADFWTNYNSARASSSRQKYYDECPTPYIDHKKSVTDKTKKNVDRSELSKSLEFFGVSLTTGETKEIIGCAHKLAEVLTLALERNNTQQNTKDSKTANDDDISL